jgi:hypothetical protein
LGFKETVENDPNKVKIIYDHINNLNVHNHDAFTTIVFSDTILVYNKVDPKNDSEHQYLSMFSCEFAQDLLYRCVGEKIFFRAILDYGEFSHNKLKNIESYYGKALIKCYEMEKKIQSIGLFISAEAMHYQNIFKMTKFNDDFYFVFLQQNFERFHESFKIGIDDYNFYESTGIFSILKKDAEILKEIYDMSKTSTDPNVRIKHLQYFDIYRSEFRKTIDSLEMNDFDVYKILKK